MNQSIQSLLKQFENEDRQIDFERKNQIKAIAETLKQQHSSLPYQLIFVCTHNSRRSIFGQVWATVLANHYDIPLKSYSGGTEVTAVNDNALTCLNYLGFEVQKSQKKDNPIVEVYYGNADIIKCFSKLYNDTQNPSDNFYAIMLCEHAAENCPFIPSALKRFNLTYPDPKKFDGTHHQDNEYKKVALEIGQELSFLLRQLQNHNQQNQDNK